MGNLRHPYLRYRPDGSAPTVFQGSTAENPAAAATQTTLLVGLALVRYTAHSNRKGERRYVAQ
ncbi:Uncharacterised protein [Vibrio cholerae]|nr:Uncharacterised protein [Vibrio cholerae]